MVEQPKPITLSFSRKELNSFLEDDNYSPEKLLILFETDLAPDFAGDVGLWEGYTLKEHTLMVLHQYEKYFGDKELPGGVDRNFFRVMLALHDIGKPQAIKERRKEHEVTWQMVEPILQSLNYDEKEINLARNVVTGYTIGKFLLTGNLEKATDGIKKAAMEAEMDMATYLDLITIYYQVDAGSYTEDAGGPQSLDYLFVFAPETRELRFSPPAQSMMAILKEHLLS